MAISRKSFFLAGALCVTPLAAAAQNPSAQFVPIPGLTGWTLSAHTGGSAQCSARIQGQSVDVMLALNGDGRVLLMAGRPDWSLPATSVEFQLQIDDGPPAALDGDGLGSLLVSLPEKALADRIEKADRLVWVLPTGRYEARVTGLSKAVAAIKACNAGESISR